MAIQTLGGSAVTLLAPSVVTLNTAAEDLLSKKKKKDEDNMDTSALRPDGAGGWTMLPSPFYG